MDAVTILRESNGDDPWSFGWWIWEGGEIEECPDEGTHVDLAWGVLDQEGMPDDAIETMLSHGAIRIATFHGSDEMNINFDSRTVTPMALTALRGLLTQTRRWFVRYHFDDAAEDKRYLRILSYREAMMLTQTAK